MDCRTFHKSLEDYLQGGLDFPGRFGIERHARQCLGCGKDLADAQKLSSMARALKRVSAPPVFEADLLRRIESRGLRRRTTFWKLQYYWPAWVSRKTLAWAAPALVLVVVGALFWMRIDQRGAESVLTVDTELPLAPIPVKVAGKSDRSLDGIQEASDLLAVKPMPSQVDSRDFEWTAESDAPFWFAEPTGTEYVEYTVPDVAGRPVVMRLPKTIRIRHAQPSEDYFIRNVSH